MAELLIKYNNINIVLNNTKTTTNILLKKQVGLVLLNLYG